jgi:hypothetical protein
MLIEVKKYFNEDDAEMIRPRFYIFILETDYLGY